MAKTTKSYDLEKIAVTAILILLTAAIFLAIGFWAGSTRTIETETISGTSASATPVADEQ